MSTITEPGLEPYEREDDEELSLAPTPGGSLRDRVRQRDRQLGEEKPIELPVPGFEDVLVARYRPLGYKEARRIGARHEKQYRRARGAQRSDSEMLIAADTLVNACLEILEVQSDGSLASTGYRWGAKLATEVFGRDLPEECTSRNAVLAIFRGEHGTRALMVHYKEYEEEAEEIRPEFDKEIAGESEASSATA